MSDRYAYIFIAARVDDTWGDDALHASIPAGAQAYVYATGSDVTLWKALRHVVAQVRLHRRNMRSL